MRQCCLGLKETLSSVWLGLLCLAIDNIHSLIVLCACIDLCTVTRDYITHVNIRTPPVSTNVNGMLNRAVHVAVENEAIVCFDSVVCVSWSPYSLREDQPLTDHRDSHKRLLSWLEHIALQHKQAHTP